MSNFCSAEGVDSQNQESTDRNADRMAKTLNTVRKIDRLFKKVTVH